MNPKLKVKGQKKPVEVEVNTTYADTIKNDIITKWQEVLDLAVAMFDVPAALIMRLHEDDLEVYAKSNNKENIFERNNHAAIGVGHYCETAIGRDELLYVKDANSDPFWTESPDAKYGLTNYLGMPLKWPDGQVFGTMCVLTDQVNDYDQNKLDLFQALKNNIEKDLSLVDRNIQLEKNLDELEKTQALLIDHEKTNLTNQLVATISHEISTPLNVALTSAAYIDYATNKLDLNEAGAKEQLMEGTALVQRNLEEAAKLLNDFKKIANDQGRMQDDWIDLPLYIKSVMKSMNLDLRAKNVSVTYDMPNNLSLYLKPGALSQVLIGLTNNALAGFNEKDHHIHIQVKDGEQVELIYSNNGSSKCDLDYQPLKKSGQLQGQGLGMNVIKTLVEKDLSGQIACQSDKKQSFKILLRKAI